MSSWVRSLRRGLAASAAAGVVLAMIAAPGGAASSFHRSSERELLSAAKANETGDEDRSEVLARAEQAAAIRLGGVGRLAPGIVMQARSAAAALPVAGGTWGELTNRPYNADSPDYADPIFSNSGGGFGLVSGRVAALATDGTVVYAGAADGGVWKSTNGGSTWTSLTDGLASLSTGALAVDPADHSVWLGTGEFNTAFENYLGTGIYRSGNGGRSWKRIGGDQFDGQMVSEIAFDGAGHAYAATSAGLFRRSSSDLGGKWQLVLQPGEGPYGFTMTNDVKVQPRTHGRLVIASFGWRSAPSGYQGFYESRHWGEKGTWRQVETRGGIHTIALGRATFAYSSEGSRLYAVVESWRKLAFVGYTALDGIFVSKGGDVAGPWQRKAGWRTLTDSGSALGAGQGYSPGVQAWYNQDIAVDPNDSNHVYVGLEEVYETTDGGSTWNTIGPYWNFTLPCYKKGPDNCPRTTHPDQHAFAFGPGVVYVGNDGGVYRRSLHDHDVAGWTDTNAALHTLQYYYSGVGHLPTGDVYWGGLQDNGVSLLSFAAGGQMVSPFGGDGGDTFVDPKNGDRAVVEYVDLDMALTTNGGRSDGTTSAFREMTPSCAAFTYTPDPCDANTQFIAPFRADPKDPENHWVAGGRYVWETTMGWDTTCSGTACDWKILHDTGDKNSITSLAVDGGVIYAGWCTLGCDPSPTFATGIDTNFGGTWHRVAGPDVTNGGDPLPQRYVTALASDPKDPAHVYAVYGGYRRHWNFTEGTGHVFESTDGGATWKDISGNLPDAPGTDLLLVNGRLVLSTDVGVFVADKGDPTQWSRFGGGLPNAAPNDLTLSPDGSYIVAATHGRGLWKITAP